jgi:uncharacterized protein (TIGR02246 family)
MIVATKAWQTSPFERHPYMGKKSALKRLGWLALAAMLGWFAAKVPAHVVPQGRAATGPVLAERRPFGGEGSAETAGRGREDAGDDDRKAILQSARDFTDAFNKGDARALGVLWTEKGELRDASGLTLLSRAAIEKAYTEFFKANPGAKAEVLVKTIRFPAKDLAVEEGLLRSPRGDKNLTGTTSYVVVHVREGGQWKMALSSEGGSGQDRLEDLDWLVGDWTAKVKDDVVKLAFVHDPLKPVITGTFSRTETGKEAVTSSMRIAADPETGRIRSWTFEPDGGHSQALWSCDGKSWVLDTRGVLANGTPTAERIILQRVGADAITLRSVDRMLGDARLADSPPLRLARSTAAH